MTQTRPEPKVIIIPAKEESPQDQEKKKNLRVAAYCRVSTKKDEQLGSYENQKAYYTEKYSLQGTTQGRYLTGGVPPVRFSM